jgi:hypothetical protein
MRILILIIITGNLTNVIPVNVPDDGYSRNVPDDGYSRNVPDDGYSRNVPDEGYSRILILIIITGNLTNVIPVVPQQ